MVLTALTASPNITRKDGSVLQYAAMDLRNDCLITGKRLEKVAGVYRYKSSPSARNIATAALKKIRREMKECPTDLLLSSEGWLFERELWEAILDRLDTTVDVIIYVRPHIPLLNSAWWQWGAWSDQQFDQWMANRLKANMWSTRIAPRQKMKRVRNVTVSPVPSDIIPDFYHNVLGAEPPKGIAHPNPSLPGPVLRLFQRNRSLRPSIHASRIDFVLSNAIFMSDSSIWVMNESWIDRVISETREDNKALLSFMNQECADAVKNDPRW